MIVWMFWLPAIALTALVLGLVALAVMRGARVGADGEEGKRDIRIYAAQLREIDRDRERGIVSGDEAERLRAETARRLLDADRKARADLSESPRSARTVVLVALLAVPLLAGAIYWNTGQYAYEDMPLALRHQAAQEARAARPSQTELETAWMRDPNRMPPPEPEPRYLELMQQLRAALVERPNDLQGYRLLATNEANLGNHAAAAAAWVRVIEIQGEDADPRDMEQLAENMILATGGIVSPEAEVVIERLLQREPRNGTARYYLGLMFAQTGRPDLTFRLWRGLLEDSQPGDPWVPAIRGTIEQLAEIAGVRYTLPPIEAVGARGPSAADMAAAANMTPEQRQEMIGNMVEGLAARLANQGGTPEEWARLINALGTLGQTDRARAILGEARTVFADQPQALALINAAGERLGASD
ncbi:MAG: c-type cytochrome biogenesis protein CcmI [Pararhodobacter sp.]